MCSQESSRRPPGPTARSERAWPSPRGPRLLRSAGEVRAPPLPVGLPLGLAPLRTYCVLCAILWRMDLRCSVEYLPG